VIYPFRHNSLWVFDDEATEHVKVPFVAGADKAIELMVQNQPDPEDDVETPGSGRSLVLKFRVRNERQVVSGPV
jgi:hypothetical protein